MGSEHEKKKLPPQQETKELRQEPVISPTMSSITMKSEFDLLGSTNLDGCRMMPAVLADNADEEDRDHRKQQSSEVMLLLRHYGVRLFGTSATWLLWDIAYYGNKLFQSSFLIALTSEDTSLVDITGGEFYLQAAKIVQLRVSLPQNSHL